MSVPDTSTGPRMNFSVPVESQVMKGLFGSSVLPLNVLMALQVSASSWAWIAAVIQFGSLASVGLAVGVVAVEPGAVGLAVGLPVLEAVGVVVDVPVTRAC